MTDEKKEQGSLSQTDWFPHDYDSSGDPGLAALVYDFKATGYGIFWHIVELLHAEADGYLPLKPRVYKSVAKNLQTDVELVEKVIRCGIDEYDLFVELDGKFTAERVQSNKKRREYIIEKRRSAGAKGGLAKSSKSQSNAKHLPVTSLPNGKQNVADKIRLDKIYSYLVVSNIQLLTTYLGDAPTCERLLGAFLEAYPRGIPADPKGIIAEIRKIWKTFELEKCKEVIESLKIDIENPDAEFFDNPIEYLNDFVE